MMLDKDGDGFIDEAELAEMFGSHNEADRKVMRKMISDIDDNKDSKIDFYEFKQMI